MLEGRGLTPGSTGGFRVAVRRMCQPFACVSLFDTSLFDASLTPLLAPLFELLTPFQVFSTGFSLMVCGMGARFLKHGCMRLKRLSTCLSRVSESKITPTSLWSRLCSARPAFATDNLLGNPISPQFRVTARRTTTIE